MVEPFDDKTEHCLHFILDRVRLGGTQRPETEEGTPLLVGINGAQGAGKTTLVRLMYLLWDYFENCFLLQ